MKKTQTEQVEHISFNQILKAKLGSSKNHEQNEQPSDQLDLKPNLNIDLDQRKDQRKTETELPQTQRNEQDQTDQAKNQRKIKDQENSMANSASLANSAHLGWQIASLANSASLAEIATPAIAKPLESQSILASLTPTQGFLRLPNWVLDSLPSLVDGNEQLMYIHLYRLSFGFGKDQCLVSLDKLAERTGVSKRTVQTVLQNLESKGLITKLGHNFGKGAMQGTIFRVATIASLADSTSLADSASQANVATIKYHHDDHIKEIDHHQKGVMTIYQTTTKNVWNKNDDQAYKKIKDIDLKTVEAAIQEATLRSKHHPNSFNYFVKAIQNHNKPENRFQRKQALEKIVLRVKNFSIGKKQTIGELSESVKRVCASEGTIYDNELFNEIMGI